MDLADVAPHLTGQGELFPAEVAGESLDGVAMSRLRESRAGEFHDQGDAKWMVIRRLSWGHNDMTAGRNRCF
jgi:hypothetical protein